MPRPYNKKTVNDAIVMLDVYASNACSVEAAAEAVGVRPSSTAYRVVDTMIDKLADMFPDDRLAYVAGEAAGLLREGWRLGDPIESHPNVTLEFAKRMFPAETVDHLVRRHGHGRRAVHGHARSREAPHDMTVWPIDPTVQSAPEALADALDAVEEPTDEEIADCEVPSEISDEPPTEAELLARYDYTETPE